MSAPSEREDALYLKLKGARESLCVAQMHVIDRTDSDALGKAIDAIDYVGSQLPQWSRFDHPSVPESNEVREAPGSGYGSGSGSGSGYGDGDGSGYGDGSGSGYGDGDGSG